MWEGSSYPKVEIDGLLDRLEKREIPIAAICAATTVIARSGILRGRKHTSNSLAYLAKMVPEYPAHADYVDTPCVRDCHVITATGLAPVDFTLEVLNELDISTPEMRSVWYEAFKHGNYPDNVGRGS